MEKTFKAMQCQLLNVDNKKVRIVLELENFDILELWQYTGEHDNILKSVKMVFPNTFEKKLCTLLE